MRGVHNGLILHMSLFKMARNSIGGFYDPGKSLPSKTLLRLSSNVWYEYRQPFQRWFIGLSDISRNDRVTKGAVHKIVHQDYDSTILLWRKRSCVDNGWHPWSNRDLKLLFRVRHVDDFRCCVRTFEESISLFEKNRYLSICLQGYV